MGAQPRLRRRLQRRRRRGERRPAGHPQPRRGAAAGVRRGDPPALARGARLGRLAGAGRRRRGRPDQLGRQPGPLHRDRLGGRPRPPDRRGAGRRARSPPLRRLPGDPAARPGARVGGFPEQFFLYHEDVDLSLRLRLRGGALGIEPAAVVDHDYEFGAGEHKWRWLERNRWPSSIRVYPAPLLAAARAGADRDRAGADSGLDRGRLGEAEAAPRRSKCCAGCPACCASAARSRRTRTVSAAEFASWLTADLDSPFIPGVARSPAGAPGPARLLAPGPPALSLGERRLSRPSRRPRVGSGLDRLAGRADQDLVDVDARSAARARRSPPWRCRRRAAPLAGAVVEERRCRSSPARSASP